MAKKHRQHDDEAWMNAKKACRLNARQVEMARALGMNPKKLPGLRPSPQQRWKLPVGEFIEECYAKRFGGNPWDHEPLEPTPGTAPREDAQALRAVRDPTYQAQDLVCYLTNLADDLQRWLARGNVGPVLLAEVGGELREIADALDAGAVIPQMPEIPTPPRETPAVSPQRGRHAPTFDDDDIPF
jgi:hypothetical protein